MMALWVWCGCEEGGHGRERERKRRRGRARHAPETGVVEEDGELADVGVGERALHDDAVEGRKDVVEEDHHVALQVEGQVRKSCHQGTHDHKEDAQLDLAGGTHAQEEALEGHGHGDGEAAEHGEHGEVEALGPAQAREDVEERDGGEGRHAGGHVGGEGRDLHAARAFQDPEDGARDDELREGQELEGGKAVEALGRGREHQLVHEHDGCGGVWSGWVSEWDGRAPA
jgi:hypothetical protein